MEYAFPRCFAIADSNNYKERDPEGICFAVGILTQVWSPDYIVGIFSEGAKNGILFAIGFRE